MRLHVRAHAGLTSFCAINDVVNCDRVATSPFSVFFGIPVAVWGFFGYGAIAGAAAWALASPRPEGRGLLFSLSSVAALASFTLMLVSKLIVGAWCLVCIASWIVAFALVPVAWRACRPEGIVSAIWEDVATVLSRPLPAAATGTAILAALALVALTYPLPARRIPPPGPPEGRPWGAQPQALLVTEFSDYECPYCAKVHEENRTKFKGRSDLRLVRKQFPLDPSCNPAVKKPIHPNACALARAALCAGTMGKFEAMDDALFANQERGAPVDVLAERIGLDVGRFRACLEAPETSSRLAAEIAEGIQAGIRVTPTFVIGRVSYPGSIPPEALPAPGRSSSPRP